MLMEMTATKNTISIALYLMDFISKSDFSTVGGAQKN